MIEISEKKKTRMFRQFSTNRLILTQSDIVDAIGLLEYSVRPGCLDLQENLMFTCLIHIFHLKLHI